MAENTLKFGKIANNPDADAQRDVAPANEMGISKAPARLIISYITDMYSHPLEAAMRETVANAIDASVLAHGQLENVRARIYGEERVVFQEDIPFGSPDAVSLKQTSTDWFFEVRDDGDGMDAEELLDVYTQYGVSRKRDEEDLTGAFGLGAKSPLAYTDEFKVYSRVKDADTLYIHAFRTEDDDFLTTTPEALVEGKAEVMNLVTGEVETVEDPFEAGEWGTIVRFPLRANRSAAKAESDHRFRYGFAPNRNEPKDKATQILAGMDYILYNTEGKTIRPEIKKTAPPAYFKFGAYPIEDADGAVANMALYATNPEKGDAMLDMIYSDQRTTTCCIFKVGNWLYPADGSAWDGTTMPTDGHSGVFIVDVPSKALSFLPSRDSLKSAGDAREPINVPELREQAFSIIGDELSRYTRAGDFLSWLVAHGSTRDKVRNFEDTLGERSFMGFIDWDTGHIGITRRNSGSTYNYYPRLRNRTCKPYTLRADMNSCVLPTGQTAFDALMSAPVVAGQVHRAPNGQLKMKHGPLICRDDDVSKFYGSGFGIEGEVYSPERDGHSGYGLASKAQIADNATSFGFTLSDETRYAAKAKQGRTQTFSATIPWGCAMMHVMPACELPSQTPVVIVDASQGDSLGAVRLKIANICENSGAVGGADDAAFFILPRKTANDNWTPAERETILAEMKSAAEKLFASAVVVKASKLPALMSKKSNKAQSSELQKLLRTNRVVELQEQRYGRKHLSSENPNYIAPKLDAIISDMTANPSNWGVVVCKPETKQGHLASEAIAALIKAMKLVPEKMKLIAVPGNRYNASRARELQNIGVAVVYDEGDVTPYQTLIPSGAFQARTQACVEVDPLKISSPYIANLNADNAKSQITEILTICSGTAPSSYFYSRPALRQRNFTDEDVDEVNRRIQTFSYGHENFRVSWPSSTASPEQWQENPLSRAHLVETDKTEVEEMFTRLRAVMKIWGSAFEKAGLALQCGNVGIKYIPDHRLLREIGQAAGVESAVTAYYSGLDLEDILNG